MTGHRAWTLGANGDVSSWPLADYVMPDSLRAELYRHAEGVRDVYTEFALDIGSHDDNVQAARILREALQAAKTVQADTVVVECVDRGNDSWVTVRFTFEGAQ